MNAPQDFRSMTADSIGKDLLSALLSEIRLLPKPWDQIAKSKQDDIIDRLRKRVETNVKMAVHLLSSQGRTVVVGDLEQITIKDGAKAVIKIGRSAESLHDLYDAQGKVCCHATGTFKYVKRLPVDGRNVNDLKVISTD